MEREDRPGSTDRGRDVARAVGPGISPATALLSPVLEPRRRGPGTGGKRERGPVPTEAASAHAWKNLGMAGESVHWHAALQWSDRDFADVQQHRPEERQQYCLRTEGTVGRRNP